MPEDGEAGGCGPGLIVRGRVFTGSGRGRTFVSLPSFRSYIIDKLGFEPFPGTLNLKISYSDAKILMDMFSRYPGYAVTIKGDHFPGRLYRALIASRLKGAVVKPEVPGYPKDVLEIIAPACIREVLNLKDGDEVEVKIFLE